MRLGQAVRRVDADTEDLSTGLGPLQGLEAGLAIQRLRGLWFQYIFSPSLLPADVDAIFTVQHSVWMVVSSFAASSTQFRVPLSTVDDRNLALPIIRNIP